jgi:hypothetical protein
MHRRFTEELTVFPDPFHPTIKVRGPSNLMISAFSWPKERTLLMLADVETEGTIVSHPKMDSLSNFAIQTSQQLQSQER